MSQFRAAEPEPITCEVTGAGTWLLCRPDRRILLQRGDADVVAVDLGARSVGGGVPEVRFPAPGRAASDR